MDFKSLQMFKHLAQSLHFGKTAEANHVSPSTLSRVIQRMEDEIGSPLLHRDNRTVVLKLSLDQKQAELKGKLHIYCSVTAAYSHLPPLLDRFRQQHPLVEIMLTTGDASDALEQVRLKSVDFAIAAKPENKASTLYFHHLAEIPLAVIAPTMACKIQQQLQEKHLDWSKIPIILPEHGAARKRFEQWYRKKQQGKPNIYATVSGHEALVSMVALGCGVGITPQVVVDNSPVKNRVQYLPSVGEIAPFELGVCCLSQRKDQPLVHAFIKAISE